jgi:3-isopropylmalate dehydratase small subunit
MKGGKAVQDIQGRVWVFGDDIDTDVITPGIYLDAPMEETVKHVLEAVRPEFPAQFKRGDIIAAGSNFGCGSSRETAPEALKTMGVGAIIARSFARIFFRNAVALGIPVLQVERSPGCFSQGDIVRVDIENVEVLNLATGEVVGGIPLYEDILDIIRAGGIIPLMREKHTGLPGS